MSARALRPFIALAGATVLSLGLVGSTVAHDEDATSEPVADAVAEDQADRQAERAERKAGREERKAEAMAARDESKADARASRESRKAERAAMRDERKAARVEAKSAWREIKDECSAELRAIRENDELDRAVRREALAEARTRCREMLAAARDERRAAAGGDATGAEATAIDFYAEAASDGTGVVRTDLGLAEPGSAPGEELGLWHYLIPAQTDLMPHTHPGWQLARVTDGELEYTVIEGEGILLRGDESEPMGPGTYLLATGDGVIENPMLIHEAANRTAEAVTIISATLYPAGAELSTLIEAGPEETSAEAEPAAEEPSTEEAAPTEG